MKYDMNRMIIALGILMLVISVVGFFVFQFYISMEGIRIDFGSIVGLGFPFLAGLALLLFSYLRGGQKIYPHIDANSKNEYVGNNYSKYEETYHNEFNKINDQLTQIEQRIGHGTSSENTLSEEEKESLVTHLKAEISKGLTPEFLSEIDSKYGEKITQESFLRDLDIHCDKTETRLRNEIESLTRRGNVNLIIGVITTLIAISILSSTVILNDFPDDPAKFASHFLPRFTLSIFIEIFSFFFLRLYSSSLSEIKYFQNELTNIESRFIALRRAVISDDTNSLSSLLINLGETERNFVLKKGETTVDLEKSRLDQQSLKDMLGAFADTVKQKK